jgi:hypothetical protein
MKTQVLIATIIGAVVAFLGGWVIWGILTMDYYMNNMSELYVNLISRDEPILWMIFLGQLPFTFLLAYVFDRMNVKSFVEGLKTGVIIFALIFAGVDLMFQATADFFANYQLMAVDIVLNGVFGGLIGGVIGWWLGRGETTSSA